MSAVTAVSRTLISSMFSVTFPTLICSLTASQVVMITRTYALFGCSKFILLLTGIAGLSFVVLTVVRFPLLIVARPTLGTVNHVLLTIEYAKTKGLDVLGVILNETNVNNQDDCSKEDNPHLIETFGRVSVLGSIPYIKDRTVTCITHTVRKHIRWKEVILG